MKYAHASNTATILQNNYSTAFEKRAKNEAKRGNIQENSKGKLKQKLFRKIAFESFADYIRLLGRQCCS